jgi:hypothetical protein
MRYQGLFGSFILCFFAFLGQAQLVWVKNSGLNNGLPPTVEVFSTTSSLPGNIPLKAWYVIADMNDPNLEFKPIGNGGTNKTPQQYIAGETDPVYVCINGGFFSGNSSLSLVMQGSTVLSPNVKQLNRTFNSVSTPYFPTRGALGMDSIRQMDVAWIYNVGALNTTYSYPAPSPNQLNVAPQPVPSDTFPAGATLWNRREAIGGSPVLISNDTIRISASEELIDVNNGGREPRTAIGYTATGKMILFVAEGRNAPASEGLSLAELAQIMKDLGCVEALNLDGGGSTAMVANGTLVNRPSDAGNLRPVASAVMIKRANLIYDTQMSGRYIERGAGWNSTAQAGFFPPSQARICQTTNMQSTATYYLTGITPGRYELSAWWPVATNRSTNTPYTLHRPGVSDSVTVRFNQSTAGGGANRFNVMGVYDLSSADSIVISTVGAVGSGPAPYFITTDAIRLTKVAESLAQMQFLPNVETVEVIRDSLFQMQLSLTSPNTGFRLNKLRIFRKIGAGAETLFMPDSSLGNVYQFNYAFNYLAANPVGPVVFRFELEDNLGRNISRTLTLQVVPLTQIIILSPNNTRQQFDRSFTFDYSVNSRRSNVNVSSVRIFRSIQNQPETLLLGPIAINAIADTLSLSRTVDEPVNSSVQLRIEATDANNETFSRTYFYKVVPKRGDFRLIAVSDMNSSFGSVSYEYQVDSIFQRIPRLWSPDMVICGGDMVAGQSASLDSTQVSNMWNAFDQKVAQPLRTANIPFAFTMGNHDASTGIQQDRLRSREYWNRPGKFPGWHPVDTSNYPYYMSFMDRDSGDVFIVSWDASDANLSQAEITWARNQLLSPKAQSARWRIVVGHMPLYGVAAERDSPGNILSNPESLRSMLEEAGVTAYVSGHHHAYFPGKRGQVELLNAGAIGSGARQWLTLPETSPNTATIMDFFAAEDTIVYTTFEIRYQNAEDMTVFNEARLPDIIPGFNGYTLNRRVKVTGQATGQFSGLHVPFSNNSNGTGAVNIVQSGNKLLINGNFSNLKGKVSATRSAIGLYRGLHADQGSIVKEMNVLSNNGLSGTFTAELPATTEYLELLSAGSFYLIIETDSMPSGEVRAQLYKAGNQAPPASSITTFAPNTTTYVRNIPGLLPINWTTPRDPEVNPITYTYQVASDSGFSTIVYQEGTGRLPEARKTQAFWYALLGQAADSIDITLYNRVVSSDGRGIVFGPTTMFKLAKTSAPVDGPVEVPAPAYVYDCTQGLDVQDNCIGPFGRTPANNGQGLAIDSDGKVWASAFSGGFTVFNPNSSVYTLSHPGVVYRNSAVVGNPPFVDSLIIGSVRERVSGVTGMGRAHDGNILISFNNRVYKLDRTTGQPLARLLVQSSGSLTNPESDSLGRIFVTTVTGNISWLLTQNGTSFDSLMINLVERPAGSITRASTISPSGREIYIPYLAVGGRSSIQKFTSSNGTQFTLASEFSAQGACKSIFCEANGRYFAAYDASGPLPSRVIYRDERDTTQILSWTYPMPAINGQDLRGLVLTVSADTFYTTSTAVGRVERHFLLPQGAGSNPNPVSSVYQYSIRQVRQVNSAGRADSAGVYCALQGIVNGPNMSIQGLDIPIVENGWGIQVFSPQSLPGISPALGDQIRVAGRIRQEYGVIRILADTITVLATNQSLMTSMPVTQLVDSLESLPLRIEGLRLLDASQWTSNSGYHGFQIEAANASDTFQVFVPKASAAYTSAVPSGELSLRGIGGQFKLNAPFNGNYLLQPRSAADMVYNRLTKLPLTAYCEGDTLRLAHRGFGPFDSSNSFVYELSDSAGLFLQPVVLGSSSNSIDSINYLVPVLPSGNYRMRVRSTAPLLRSANNGFDVSINPKPLAAISLDSLTSVLQASPGGTSYQWFLAGQAITGVNSPSLPAANAGSYTVLVTRNGCSRLSAPFIVLGTEASLTSADLRLFPNPTTGELNLQFSSPASTAMDISLSDLSGKPVKHWRLGFSERKSVQLSLHDLPTGTYLLKISTSQGSLLRLVVKQ